MKPIKELLYNLYIDRSPNKEVLVYILKNITEEDFPYLFDLACKAKTIYYGKSVYMRGLIEFSNICSRNCLYCGLRNYNKKISRYRLSKEEILECCTEGYALGYRTFVLQSGEDAWFNEKVMTDIIKSIKNRFPDTALTLSIGERTKEEYESFFKAGADRYLLRHETATEHLYNELHPGMSFQNRRDCLKILKDIGYQVGAGFMTGLPGQTEDDIAQDLLFLKEINPDMIGIGPFIPHSGTPLRNEKGGTVKSTLLAIALARLLVPDSLIPATTAIGTLDKNGREMALKAGANVVMPNLTPMFNRAKYELYEDKICLDEDSAQCRNCIESRIINAGFEVDMGIGDSLKEPRFQV